MTHYVCKGECNGVAETEGTCQMETCSKHGEALVACECTDGNHGKSEEPATEEQVEEQPTEQPSETPK